MSDKHKPEDVFTDDMRAAWSAALDSAISVFPGGTHCDPQVAADEIRKLMMKEPTRAEIVALAENTSMSKLKDPNAIEDLEYENTRLRRVIAGMLKTAPAMAHGITKTDWESVRDSNRIVMQERPDTGRVDIILMDHFPTT